MEWLYQLVKSLILPPGLLLVLLLFASLGKRRMPLLLVALMFYLLSTPFFAAQLSRGLEQHPPLSATQLAQTRAEAIVVLTGGRHQAAAEYGGDTVGSATLERLRYAALLQQRTGLPIIVSGGSPYAEEPIGEAELALPVLQAWGAHPVLIESNSANTRENARLSLQLLQNRGIHRILLVTHAWHMPRALQAFGKGTLRITAAPTGFYHTAVEALDPGWRRWLSDAGALRQSSRALHEYLGMLWFKIRG